MQPHVVAGRSSSESSEAAHSLHERAWKAPVPTSSKEGSHDEEPRRKEFCISLLFVAQGETRGHVWKCRTLLNYSLTAEQPTKRGLADAFARTGGRVGGRVARGQGRGRGARCSVLRRGGGGARLPGLRQLPRELEGATRPIRPTSRPTRPTRPTGVTGQAGWVGGGLRHVLRTAAAARPAD